MREDKHYRMWFTGYKKSGLMKLGYAPSRDGLMWNWYKDNPIYDEH